MTDVSEYANNFMIAFIVYLFTLATQVRIMILTQESGEIVSKTMVNDDL